eukprot:504417_1
MTISTLCLCALFINVQFAHGDQTYKLDPSEGDIPLFTLDTGTLEDVKVYHVVGYDEHQAGKIPLKLKTDQLDQFERDTAQFKGDIRTITAIGQGPGCGKAFALKSTGIATINAPPNYPQEKLYNLQFPSSCATNRSAGWGLYISAPIRRYGHLFCMMMLRTPKPGGNDQDGFQRLRSLPLSVSSGVIIITSWKKFGFVDDDVASAVVLMTGDQGNFSKIPIVGLRNGEMIPGQEFADEFFSQDGFADLPYKKEKKAEVLRRMYNAIALRTFDLPGKKPELSKEFSQDTFGFFQKYTNETRQHEDPERWLFAKMFIDSLRAFARMGNYIMEASIGGDMDASMSGTINKKVVTRDGLISLIRTSVPYLNSRDFGTKAVSEQIASHTCADMVDNMFKEPAWTNGLFLRIDPFITLSDDLDMNALSQNGEFKRLKQEYITRGKSKLEQKVPILWTTIERECSAVFDEKFDRLWSNTIVNAARVKERRARLEVQRQLDQAKWLEFFVQNWQQILIGSFIVMTSIWILCKVAKCVNCCNQLFGRRIYPAETKKLVAKLNKVLDENKTIVEEYSHDTSENISIGMTDIKDNGEPLVVKDIYSNEILADS